jgi:hypothetical protein
MDRRKRKAASWPVAPFHGIGIVGYRMTALRQRPEFVFDELLINTFDPRADDRYLQRFLALHAHS